MEKEIIFHIGDNYARFIRSSTAQSPHGTIEDYLFEALNWYSIRSRQGQLDKDSCSFKTEWGSFVLSVKDKEWAKIDTLLYQAGSDYRLLFSAVAGYNDRSYANRPNLKGTPISIPNPSVPALKYGDG